MWGVGCSRAMWCAHGVDACMHAGCNRLLNGTVPMSARAAEMLAQASLSSEHGRCPLPLGWRQQWGDGGVTGGGAGEWEWDLADEAFPCGSRHCLCGCVCVCVCVGFNLHTLALCVCVCVCV